MNEMVTPGGKQNRGMYDVNGQVLFVDKDVAKALNYKDSSDALKRHVENEDKQSRRITDSGQRRKTYLINESGQGRGKRRLLQVTSYIKRNFICHT